MKYKNKIKIKKLLRDTLSKYEFDVNPNANHIRDLRLIIERIFALLDLFDENIVMYIKDIVVYIDVAGNINVEILFENLYAGNIATYRYSGKETHLYFSKYQDGQFVHMLYWGFIYRENNTTGWTTDLLDRTDGRFFYNKIIDIIVETEDRRLLSKEETISLIKSVFNSVLLYKYLCDEHGRLKSLLRHKTKYTHAVSIESFKEFFWGIDICRDISFRKTISKIQDNEENILEFLHDKFCKNLILICENRNDFGKDRFSDYVNELDDESVYIDHLIDLIDYDKYTDWAISENNVIEIKDGDKFLFLSKNHS